MAPKGKKNLPAVTGELPALRLAGFSLQRGEKLR